ncbi:hypothetical protein [Pedobacter sp. GR22-10]|uniref:hypothetical protein n=1 Tax=Pedobacter sp. GR22-10 TaxID=2994472 RepID=UPI00224833A2|nr:hypothetical protein [Pedobacter sp. GR22-10]MCX2429884.1 hypothetical protein [Pedobacter sp. GR22-10]
MELFENEHFQVDLNGLILQIKEHDVGNQQVFHISFPDQRNPLVIHKASTVKGKVWMSIPQGRQKEAEEIGDLITAYFKTK